MLQDLPKEPRLSQNHNTLTSHYNKIKNSVDTDNSILSSLTVDCCNFAEVVELSNKEKIISAIQKIPLGKVTSYGYIGKQVGLSGYVVGFVLSSMTFEQSQSFPWYRVVRKDGYISSLKLGQKGLIQKNKLIEEGYTINNDIVDSGHMII